MSLIRIAEAIENLNALAQRILKITARESELEKESADWKNQKFSADKNGICPYCNTENVVLYIRGNTIFGCFRCTGLLALKEFAEKNIK